ncbi:unnamed protein product [Parascedosporium putredinis]|uniref:Cyclase n=1 Tax=Parascedosporium putredinis TaxID=1442378 RepID=A0A9P1H959_9PEZI|nr:unnamed protein product [Parascedosporium putredinis]CAI8000624.1 unnamed protein product [Parascedosporium putredinis]
MAEYENLPDFDSLPASRTCPKVVKDALDEARDGVSISLNWDMAAAHGFDDEITFNPQSASQWDSLVHVAHQPTGLSYNGCKPTKQALLDGDDACLPSLNHWHARGGLVARGVLLDYRAYAHTKGIAYDCFSNHGISVQDLEAVAAFQGTTFKQGDVVIIRTGFTEDLGAADADEQVRMMNTHQAVGVKGNRESAKWFWNHHFAAVAGDTIAFEVMPPLLEDEGDKPGETRDLVLHQYFLSLFGLPIGELWDLKALAEHCQKIGRYSFLLTSAPLNLPASVGSPPNALAIF